MSEYEVEIFETVRHSVNVIANNREEAYETAYELIRTGDSNLYCTESEGFTGLWNAYEV